MQKGYSPSHTTIHTGPHPAARPFIEIGHFLVVAHTRHTNRNEKAGSVVVWDVATGATICDFQEHIKGPRTVAFGPEGMTVLSGSMGLDGGGDLILWDTITCDILQRLSTNDNIAGVDFSADGNHALSASNTGQMTLWDLETGEAVRIFEVPGDFFLDAAFGPQDETVLASAISGLIVQWDRETGEEIRLQAVHIHLLAIPHAMRTKRNGQASCLPISTFRQDTAAYCAQSTCALAGT